MKFLADKANRVALVLAAGLILIVAHYQGQPGMYYVFIPQVGMAILLGATLIMVMKDWKSLDLGPKAIWIPLAIIAGSAVLRVAVYMDMDALAGALFMSTMFGLYVIARRYGERALSFFLPFVIIGAISIFVDFGLHYGEENPGIFSEYATASQFLVFGWLMSPRKHQWWLSGVVLAGLFFSGAEEALFYIAVIGIVVLIRKDWSRKILVPVGALVLLLVICTPLGATQQLFGRGLSMIGTAYTATNDETLTPEQKDEMLNEATNGRWLYGWRPQRAIQPLGYGINLTYHYRGIPHNMVLLVTDQLGPVAMLAWFGVIIVGYRKTKWKYAFLALLLFGVFQPFVWTKMAPWFWVAAGSATASNRESYIFRDVVATRKVSNGT